MTMVGPPPYNQSNEWGLLAWTNSNHMRVCYAPTMVSTNGVFLNEDPMNFSLPLFILQVLVIIVTTRVLIIILTPFGQPKIVAEMLSGLLLGSSGIGYFSNMKKYGSTVLPLRSTMVLETMANVGLLYYMFLIGVEMDLNSIKRTSKKAMIIALVSMVVPFIVAVCGAMYLQYPPTFSTYAEYVMIAVALSQTASPVVARILADLKLFNTEVGKLAMSAAYVNDILAWVLLTMSVAVESVAKKNTPNLFGSWQGTLPSCLSLLLCIVAYCSVCFLVIRPAITQFIKPKLEGENFDDFYVCPIVAGVIISGFITDAMGFSSIFGAFIFGLIIPNGKLTTNLMQKLEDFVNTILLPLYFTMIGIETNIVYLIRYPYPYAIHVIPSAIFSKLVITFLVVLFQDMPFLDGVALVLLMNTKGLMQLILVKMTYDLGALQLPGYIIIVLINVGMSFIITPIISGTYKPARHIIVHRRRTIQKSKGDPELRILVAVHTPRNVPSIISLLEASYPTKKSPFCIYTLQLVELTDRASSMLVFHSNAYKNYGSTPNNVQPQSDHIINAFRNYAKGKRYATILPLTAISPYSTMHEDICNLAEEKRISLIVVPFHKQQTVDGRMETANPSFRDVNQNVLANAPCSVGILIDRGFKLDSANHTSNHIVVLFFGGPDDREALAYAWSMAENPCLNLTILRFVHGKESQTQPSQQNLDGDRNEILDHKYISYFNSKSADYNNIEYKEVVVYNMEETVATIRTMEFTHGLYIVGRREGIISPLTRGLTEWCECPELGAIGDLIATSNIGAMMSVLVVQQYTGVDMFLDEFSTPRSSSNSNNYFGDMTQPMRTSADNDMPDTQ